MRRCKAFLLLAMLTAVLESGRPAAAAGGPQVSAGAAILMDWKTGAILWEKNAQQRRDPASTTKVMTAVIVLEQAKLSDTVSVSKRAAYTPGSSIYLRPGQVISVHDLLHGLLLRSGNDAAAALAEHVSGSVEGFARLMNARAKELGLKNTHFVNPHGLTEANHYSSAHDLALLTRHALRNKIFADIVAAREKDLVLEQLNRSVHFQNTNALLWRFEGADGVKTGTTSAAGACLIGSATRGEQRLISVVLHAGNRWRDSANLLEWGYHNFRLLDLVHQGEFLKQVPVAGGREKSVPLVAALDLSIVAPAPAQEAPQVELEIPELLQAPVRRGQQVGSAVVRIRGEVKARVPVQTAAAVGRQSLLGRLLDCILPPLRWMLDRGIAF